jgi:UDP-N-acetylmuramate dehydrogenase
MIAACATMRLRGELRVDAPLKCLNSWRVGGTAERLYRPADIEDLVLFLSTLDVTEPLFWLGLGTNVLVRDGGVCGTVIAVHAALNRISQLSPLRIHVQAGVPCAKLARFSTARNLAGAEFMVGIPGSLGGALAMNAGAFGGQTWDVVASVETVDRWGNVWQRLPAEFNVGYRDVGLPAEEWFLGAELELSVGDKATSLDKIKTLLAKRQMSQPLGVASCGSVFRNPPGDFAARLIETAGLKGYCLGGARVSDKHANFIINTGNATAAEIEALIEHVQRHVADAHGVQLVPEVRIMGEHA